MYHQKDAIKNGIMVDGRHFKVKFTGNLCLPISTLYIFLFYFAMFLCYMSSHVIILLLNQFYTLQC